MRLAIRRAVEFIIKHDVKGRFHCREALARYIERSLFVHELFDEIALILEQQSFQVHGGLARAALEEVLQLY